MIMIVREQSLSLMKNVHVIYQVMPQTNCYGYFFIFINIGLQIVGGFTLTII